MNESIDIRLFDRVLQNKLDNASCSASRSGSCIKTQGLRELKRKEAIIGFIENEGETGSISLNRRKKWLHEDVLIDEAKKFEVVVPCRNECPARHFCSQDKLLG